MPSRIAQNFYRTIFEKGAASNPYCFFFVVFFCCFFLFFVFFCFVLFCLFPRAIVFMFIQNMIVTNMNLSLVATFRRKRAYVEITCMPHLLFLKQKIN